MATERGLEVKALWEQGLSIKAIAARLDIALTTVTYWAYYVFRFPRRSVDAAQYNTTWGAEMDNKLRELWAGNMVTKEIGKLLDKSKSAVIGRAHRLGLAAKKKGVKRGTKRASPARPRVVGLRKRKVVLPPTQAMLITPTLPGEAGGVHILDLEERHCRYITHKGEDGLARYCGATKPHLMRNAQPFYLGSWCAEHAARCFQPRL